MINKISLKLKLQSQGPKTQASPFSIIFRSLSFKLTIFLLYYVVTSRQQKAREHPPPMPLIPQQTRAMGIRNASVIMSVFFGTFSLQTNRMYVEPTISDV